MKRIAILQSNYIPWKGYFDLIASVDEFILYDDMQFTKNDWRNRNKIKTPKGLEWITIPVGQDINRKIREVNIYDRFWQHKHWKTLQANYSHSKYFDLISYFLKPIYLEQEYKTLSSINRKLIEEICNFLNISTKIKNSWEYDLIGDKTQRLVNICKQAEAGLYLSGPAAKSYIDETIFLDSNIEVKYFSYSDYLEYPQLWGKFSHEVSILDLLFNCGKDSVRYMKFENFRENYKSEV